jgi:23S rRNA pseudouridine2457 synthase
MRCLLLNKPFQVLSRFTDEKSRTTLGQFVRLKNVYPAGRLDYDSEGLLFLTDDGRLQSHLSNPRHRLRKVYWAQVEGAPQQQAVRRLREGVRLKDGPTRPAEVRAIDEPSDLWPRNPPIRSRRHIPTHWLEIGITEGRNRQVRRMTAAVGMPTLRLIRCAIGPWALAGLAPGEMRELDPREVLEQLRLQRGAAF